MSDHHPDGGPDREKEIEGEISRLRALLPGTDTLVSGQPGGASNGSVPIAVEAEAFLLQVLASSADCIKLLDLDGKIEYMNAGGLVTMEVDDFNAIAGCPWPSFWTGQEYEFVRKAMDDALAGRTGRFQGPANTHKGTPKWWDVVVTMVPASASRPARLLAVSRDITELKRGEEQQRILVRELDHRIKNILAMVQAIASQTLKTAPSLETARRTLGQRLILLGHAHDILTRSSWTKAPLRDLVDSTLKPFAVPPEQLSVQGPDITLGARAALSLTLTLHELGTNAIKYGALSEPGGRVGVRWEVRRDTDEPQFHCEWIEREGPKITAPGKPGFGSLLIRESMGAAFSGMVKYELGHDGARWTLDAPLAAVQQN